MIVGRTLASVLAAGLMHQGLQAQQILTAVNTDQEIEGPDNDYEYEAHSSTKGDVVAHSYLGTETRAQTNFGVNKAYASSNNGIELSATSAWLDTYTATAGVGKVTVTMNFAIDGIADFNANLDDSAPYYNFKVIALRGDGWSLNGHGDGGWGNDAYVAGSDYDDLFLQKMQGEYTSQISVRDDARTGVYTYADNGGTAGAFQWKTQYDPVNDVYYMSVAQGEGMSYLAVYEGETVIRDGSHSGPVIGVIQHGNSDPTQIGFAARRAALEENYALYDSASLCCGPTTYDLGTTLSLSFEVDAGSTFSIAAVLVLDNLTEGMLDFYNTATVSSITAVDAENNAVALLNPNLVGTPGNYGYVAVVAPPPAVPEPAAWAMMISGFAMAGGLLRGRARRISVA
jgi:hypothetical protein